MYQNNSVRKEKLGLDFRLRNMWWGPENGKEGSYLPSTKTENITKGETQIILGGLKAPENFCLIKLFTPCAVNILLAIQVRF